jgi:hypothetical protein
MSCAYKANFLSAVIPTPNNVEAGWRILLRRITAIIDAFREALEMRRVVQRKYFLGDE